MLGVCDEHGETLPPRVKPLLAHPIPPSRVLADALRVSNSSWALTTKGHLIHPNMAVDEDTTTESMEPGHLTIAYVPRCAIFVMC